MLNMIKRALGMNTFTAADVTFESLKKANDKELLQLLKAATR